MGDQPLRLIQISDMHLLTNPKGALLGVKTQESLQAVLDLVKKENPKVDLILLSGDLSQDGSAIAYRRLAELMQSFNVPVYCIPGNHDNPKVMDEVYPLGRISADRHILLKNWQLILLNSEKPGAVAGFLDESQLAYLEKCLQKYPEHHALISFHHQPIPVGSKWLDKLGLLNADKFWQIVKKYPKVSTILFGHVHQEFEQTHNGIKCLSVPSTCIQFTPHKPSFALDYIPPGYRWIDIYDQGQIRTGINRVAEYIGRFEAKAKGY